MAYDQEAVNRDLTEKDSQGSQFQSKFLAFLRKKIRYAQDNMDALHTRWESADYIYRGYRISDRDDAEAVVKKEPTKIILPVTYAQTQTALGFIFSTFLQKERMIELVATGGEDVKGVEALETDIHYQLTKQKFYPILYCWALDAFRYGVGVGKVHWKEKYQKMRIGKKRQLHTFLNKLVGRDPTEIISESTESVMTYQGNEINYVSPYSFAVDPNVAIAKFQEGEYVVQEEAVSKHVLKREEGTYYFGTKHIESKFSKLTAERFTKRFGPLSPQENRKIGKDPLGRVGSDEVFRTEVQITLVPKMVSRDENISMLGNEDFPVKYLVVIANDGKIIKCERLGYLHDLYTFFVGEYSPDLSAFWNPGLSDTIYELQNTMSFLINSHIVNVRKTVKSRFLYDPEKVEGSDLKEDSMYIRTRPNAAADVNKAIKQLESSDITRAHIQDLEVLNKFVQLVSGINENALGQYAGGRRSATEARNVNAGAASRLKMHAVLLWSAGLSSMAEQILSNTRQGRTKEVYDMIVGEDLALSAPFETTILADPTKISGGYDLLPYDATLPSDKTRQAEVLTKLFEVLIGNPNTIQILNKNPMKLMESIVRLYGIKNLNDYNLEDLPPQGAIQPEVVPDEVAGELNAAGASPVDVTGENLIRGLASA
jgi:hypothetical protein